MYSRCYTNSVLNKPRLLSKFNFILRPHIITSTVQPIALTTPAIEEPARLRKIPLAETGTQGYRLLPSA